MNTPDKRVEEIVKEFHNKYLHLPHVWHQLVKSDEHLESIKPVTDWLRTTLTQKDAERADWLRSEIEKLEGMKDYDSFDEMCCAKCGDFIRERVSHHSEDGFSMCCGKKLVREQGKRDTYSEKNQALTPIITRYKEELKVLEDLTD